MSGNARRFRPEKIDAAGVEELNNSDYIVQSGTCEVYEVVLKVNGDGALEAGADQWSKTKNTNTVDAAMFFAQTCILQMERQKEEGSMSPAISYEQSPKQWQELCMLAAKMKMGCANAEERTKVQSLMIKSDSVNIRFNKDIETAKERQKIINLNAKNKKNGNVRALGNWISVQPPLPTLWCWRPGLDLGGGHEWLSIGGHGVRSRPLVFRRHYF